MPITLAQAAVNTANDVDFAVIDDFRRNSWLFDNLTWDDVVTPGTTGASLTYSYVRKTSGTTAAPRAINTEYTPAQAARLKYSVDLKPLGGAFNVDRVLANIGQAQTNETMFQMMELLVATRERVIRELVYGDTATNVDTFDGLSKALTGTSTELTTSTNWSTVATQVAANQELDKLDNWLSKMVSSKVGSMTPGQPGEVIPGRKAILGNTRAIQNLKNLARWAALPTVTKDNFDRDIDSYKGFVLVDLGDRADGTNPIIPVTSNVTEIFAVHLGMDAVHMASVGGAPLVRSWLPDFTTAGAVKTGEVELGPAAFVLKSTKAAGVYRNITVAA